MSGARLLSMLAGAALMSGCLGPAPFTRPAPEREWRDVLQTARAAADSGRFVSADRWLSEFALKYPGSVEAHESLYWRAVFRLSPGNDTASQRQAPGALHDYLAKPGGRHRSEARALLELATTRAKLERAAEEREREIAQIRTALGRAEARSSAPAEQPRESGLAEEVTRLKAELTRANQELERIRRRLRRP